VSYLLLLKAIDPRAFSLRSLRESLPAIAHTNPMLHLLLRGKTDNLAFFRRFTSGTLKYASWGCYSCFFRSIRFVTI
jgi:hypothetical protein